MCEVWLGPLWGCRLRHTKEKLGERQYSSVKLSSPDADSDSA